ncbi:phosphotransferase [Actinomadura sp. DC4]|uniref:phosphotransferase family protein n=1 Tax=Actinomadura sp. DC4 TaxID=3055069 RepID=UPI0025B182E0|nr:phosphotransferase [Actinomadura sp. DC4]MDN3357574.1 phosphotransferase [Actinomadura sp. DC4]
MSVVDGPGDLTPEWLTGALGATVGSVSWEPVGSGQIGACYRLDIEGDGVPARLIAKLAAPDVAARAFLAPVYRNEVCFYRELAGTVAVRTPACHYSALAEDATTFVLLLEDLSPAVQGDQLAGCTPEQGLAAVVNLAGLHGPRWCDPALRELPWMNVVGPEDAVTLGEVFRPAVDTFVERFTGRLGEEDVRTLYDVADRMAAWVVGRPERFGLVHGDYRLDNLLFDPDGKSAAAVDWQTLSLGHPVRDLAYFVGTSMDPPERRRHERALVEAYHAALLAHGVADYTGEECFEDYRFAAAQGPLITVLGCAYGARTERGDRMFLAMAARSCAAIRDLGTLDLV